MGSTDQTFALGLKQGVVLLMPHNPAWQTAFAIEAAAIRTALGPEQAFIDRVAAER